MSHLEKLGSAIALTAFRRARIEQGQAKIAAGVPAPGSSFVRGTAAKATTKAPDLKPGRNGVGSVDIGFSSTGGATKRASGDELEMALERCLVDVKDM